MVLASVSWGAPHCRPARAQGEVDCERARGLGGGRSAVEEIGDGTHARPARAGDETHGAAPWSRLSAARAELARERRTFLVTLSTVGVHAVDGSNCCTALHSLVHMYGCCLRIISAREMKIFYPLWMMYIWPCVSPTLKGCNAVQSCKICIQISKKKTTTFSFEHQIHIHRRNKVHSVLQDEKKGMKFIPGLKPHNPQVMGFSRWTNWLFLHDHMVCLF